tara:strand:- start:1283 stop:1600 length:318 start_codon:yes stop_codon:yes gene_type:complete
MKYIGRLSSAVLALSLLGSNTSYAGNCYSHGEKSASVLMEKAKDLFKSADMNNDDSLSKIEHNKAGLDKYGVAFDAFDIDKNNKISWDEYAIIFRKHHGDKGSDA